MRIPAALICCALAAPAAVQAQNAGSFTVGVTSRHVLPDGPYDWRGAGSHALAETIWYPADAAAVATPQRFGPPDAPLFEAAAAAPEAKLAASPIKLPLVMLSHGTGGTAQSLAWFASALAAHGYVVAAVNHPGNNAVEPATVQGFALWWLRARDISAALDDLLDDPDFGRRIDRRRIGGAGMSLGGYTAIELAGGITARRQFEATCRAAPEQVSCKAPPEYPDLVAKADALAAADPDFARALHRDGASYRDRRIRAAFVMAPALGPAVTAASLRAISIPVAIVAGAADSIAPVDANAKYYADHIPGAKLTLFAGGVDHYTFLDVCTAKGRAAIPAICVDHPGVDRAAIQAATAALATKFFDAALR